MEFSQEQVSKISDKLANQENGITKPLCLSMDTIMKTEK